MSGKESTSTSLVWTRMRSMRAARAVSVVLLVAMLLLVLLPSSARAAASISASPTSITVGTNLVITGSGFGSSRLTHNDQLQFASGQTLSFCNGGGAPVVAGSCTTTPGGAFNVTINLIWGNGGVATVRVTDGITSATTTITVVPAIYLSPSTGGSNSFVLVTGTGFDWSGYITNLSWDGNAISTSTDCFYMFITNTGNFSCYFWTPTVPYGPHTVQVQDDLFPFPDTGSAIFVIEPSINIFPSIGRVGSFVQVGGSGFTASTPYTVYWTTGTGALKPVTGGYTNPDGTLPFTYFFTPTDVEGFHTVEVRDFSGVSQNTTFDVLPQIFLGPNAGPVGSTVRVLGNGFFAATLVTLYWDYGLPTQQSLGSVTTNALGNLTGTFVAPSAFAGGHALTAVPAVGATAAATFTISPSLAVNPFAGPTGITVSSTVANGLSASTNARLIWDPGLPTQTTLNVGTTNATGGIAFGPWTVPVSAPKGIHVLWAEDNNGVTAIAFFAVGPTLIVTPTIGPVNTTVTVDGFNFGAGNPVSIYYAGQTHALANTTASVGTYGNFTTTFIVPTDPAGTYPFWANVTAGASAEANFTVIPSLTESVSYGPVGTVDHLTIQGMAAYTFVAVAWDFANSNIQQVTNGLGSVSIAFTIPHATAGYHVIDAVDAYSDASNAVYFYIVPHLEPSVTSAYVGDHVSVNATGFSGSVPVTLTWNGSAISGSTVTSSPSGDATLSFVVPGPAGTYPLGAYDSSFDVAPSLAFTAWALAVPTPTAPLTGSYVNTSSFSLVWSTVPNANVTYTVELSSSPTFSSGTSTWSGITWTNLGVGPVTDGQWYWRVEAVTAAGASGGWSTTESFLVDTTAPVANVSALPQYETSLSFSLAWTASDAGSGVAGVYLYWSNDSGAVWYQVTGGLETSSPTSFTAPGAGSYEFQAIGLDHAGNLGKLGVAQASTIVDPTAPSVAYALNGTVGAGGWYTGPVTVTLSAAGGPSGVAAIHYRVNGGAWVNYTGAFLVSAAGNTTLTAYATSHAGIAGSDLSQTISIDAVRPVLASNASSGWYSASPVTIGLTGLLAGPSGIAEAYWSVDGGNWHAGTTASVAGNGVHALAFYAVSGAGLQGPTQTATVRIDSAAPTTSVLLAGPLGLRGWYTGAVTVSVSAPAGASGLSGVFVSVGQGAPYVAYNGSFGFDVVGTTAISAYAVSGAGLVGPVTQIVVHIDPETPVTSSSAQSGWYNRSTVSIALGAVGGPSGVAQTYWSVDGSNWTASTTATVTGDGVHTLLFYSVSGAGLSEPVRNQTIRIDATPPRTSALLAGNLTASGWYSTAVTLTLTATDATSGVVATFYNTSAQPGWVRYTAPLVFTTTGTTRVYYYSVDAAGNAEPVGSVSFQIDLAGTSSTMPLTGNVPTWSGVVDYSVSLSDPAGVREAWIQVDNGPQMLMTLSSPGATTVTATFSVDTTGLANGRHLLTVTAVNELGQSHVFSTVVGVDNPSLGPLALLVGLAILLVVGMVALLWTRPKWGTPPASSARPVPTGPTGPAPGTVPTTPSKSAAWEEAP